MIHFLVLNKVYAKASESGVRMLQMGMAVNKGKGVRHTNGSFFGAK